MRVAGTVVASVLFALSAVAVQAQPRVVGCELLKDAHYKCGRESFMDRLAKARTVRVAAPRMDPYAADRTKQLVQDLGKTVEEGDGRADLVFEIAPVDRSGRVDFGPGDAPLATLKVYDPALGAGPQSLVWVETLDGHTDRPWPADVGELLKQFQRVVVDR